MKELNFNKLFRSVSHMRSCDDKDTQEELQKADAVRLAMSYSVKDADIRAFSPEELLQFAGILHNVFDENDAAARRYADVSGQLGRIKAVPRKRRLL